MDPVDTVLTVRRHASIAIASEEAIVAFTEAKLLRVASLTAFVPIAWGSTCFVTRQWLPGGISLTRAALRALPAGLLPPPLLTRRLPHRDWGGECGGLLLVPVALVVEGVREPFVPAELLGFAHPTLIATGVAYVVWSRGLLLLPRAWSGSSVPSTRSPVRCSTALLRVSG